MVKKAKLSASEEAFTIQEGLDKVRSSATMYLGQLGEDMVYRSVKEPVDNCYDEAMAGRNKFIEVILNLDNDFICVADKGPGIPVSFKKLKKGGKISIMTAAFTELHAGGKFNDTSYKTSAGTHGVGVSAVNAISDALVVYSFVEYKSKKKIWAQKFERGEPASGEAPVAVKKLDSNTLAMLSEKPNKYGTIVCFKLDQTIVSVDARRGKKLPKNFTKAEPNVVKIGKWLSTMAMLNPGLAIRFTTISKGKPDTKDFLNKKDLAWVVKDLASQMELESIGKPFVYKSDFISCTMMWTDSADSDQFQTFVNASPTVDGGYHLKGLLDAMSQALKPYNAAKGKTKKNGFTTSDLQIGLIGLYDWRMHGAQYTSQVKDKLASKVDTEVYKELLPELEKYFKANSRVAKNIIKRAQALAKGREDLSATIKSMASVKKKNKGNALPEFLAAAPHAKPHERELVVVEGDSAGGCFIGSTPVKIADGRTISFEELAERTKKGELFEGVSFNIEKAQFEAHIFEEPRLTKYVDELVEVEMSDGTIYVCTLDHPWLVNHSVYVAAENLEPGDVLTKIDDLYKIVQQPVQEI